jgi:hypothetical protein
MDNVFCVKGQKVHDKVINKDGIAFEVIPEDECVIIDYQDGSNLQERYFMDVRPL